MRPNFRMQGSSCLRSSRRSAAARWKRQAAERASAPWSAFAIWDALPRNVTSVSCEPARRGPGFEASVPFGRSGQRWKPKILSAWTFLKIPDSQTIRAPPVVSSAGWKTRSTERGSSSAQVTRWCASPRSIAMCPSCPQACILCGCVEAKGTPVVSVTGKASISERRAVVCSLPRSRKRQTVERQGWRISAFCPLATRASLTPSSSCSI